MGIRIYLPFENYDSGTDWSNIIRIHNTAFRPSLGYKANYNIDPDPQTLFKAITSK